MAKSSRKSDSRKEASRKTQSIISTELLNLVLLKNAWALKLEFLKEASRSNWEPVKSVVSLNMLPLILTEPLK